MPRRKATPEGIVAELYTLLETISSDGVITEEEAADLHAWLLDNRDTGIPSFEFLRTLLDQLLTDGKVTPAEQKAIHAAVEKVLPKELRAKAKAARQARQLAMKAKLANEREAIRLRKPIGRFNFMAAGISHENRHATVELFVQAGTVVYLAREPENAYDRNAVALRLREGYSIGYVPREDAVDLAPLLDAGASHVAYCTKILQGRRISIPVIDVTLYRGDQDIPNAVRPDQVPVHAPTVITVEVEEDLPTAPLPPEGPCPGARDSASRARSPGYRGLRDWRPLGVSSTAPNPQPHSQCLWITL